MSTEGTGKWPESKEESMEGPGGEFTVCAVQIGDRFLKLDGSWI